MKSLASSSRQPAHSELFPVHTGGVLLSLVTLTLALCAPDNAPAQGCVASGINPCAPIFPGDPSQTIGSDHEWLATVSYRWFKSDRHFVGDVEQPQRQANHTEVINDVHSFDIAVSYSFTKRWSATVSIPFIDADRSSLYEHDRTNRHSMHSSGLGDIRLITDVWLFDPQKNMNGNLALGVGVKFPTGDDHVTDTAYRATGPVERPVDPSVQPGDGGWGILLELQAYQRIYVNLSAYLQGSYLITPEEQNNTQTTLGDNPTTPSVRKYDSITDQYFGRGGFNYVILPSRGVSLSLGARIEGVPVYDAVGGSMGFRRPGYTISIEPGMAWRGKKNSLSITAPVAVYRNRERSAPEIALGRPGGDAAFADFSILASFTHRF